MIIRLNHTLFQIKFYSIVRLYYMGLDISLLVFTNGFLHKFMHILTYI